MSNKFAILNLTLAMGLTLGLPSAFASSSHHSHRSHKSHHSDSHHGKHHSDGHHSGKQKKNKRSFVVGVGAGFSQLNLARGNDVIQTPSATSFSIWGDHFFTDSLSLGILVNQIAVTGNGQVAANPNAAPAASTFTYRDVGLTGTASYYMTPFKQFSLVFIGGFGTRTVQFTRDMQFSGISQRDTNIAMATYAPLLALDLNTNVGDFWILSSRLEYWTYSINNIPQNLAVQGVGLQQQYSFTANSATMFIGLGAGF